MKFIAPFLLSISLLSAQVPTIFKGLFEEEIAVKGSIGAVAPPPEIKAYISKVETAARKDPEWFKEFSSNSKPGLPLPYHEKLGLTEKEYEEYRALWKQREFKEMAQTALILRKTFNDTWSLTATGEAGTLSTLRYDPEKDSFRSPNGELERIEDINADELSILGEWSGKEWRFEEETGLGKIKENFAMGTMGDTGFGLVIYRAQEISTEGSRLMDKSLVIRFPLGKAGHIQMPAPPKP